MSISPIGLSMIGNPGPLGSGAAAAQIASNVGNSGGGTPVAEDLQLAVLEKVLQTATARAVDLHV